MKYQPILSIFAILLSTLACGLPSAAPTQPTVVSLPPTPNLPFSSGLTEAPAASPFTGTWSGPDNDDGSVVTVSLTQSGNSLSGSFSDTFSGSVTPGYAGQGSGSVDSVTTARITFNMTRGDGRTTSASFSLTLSNQNNTLTLGCDTGCPIVLQR